MTQYGRLIEGRLLVSAADVAKMAGCVPSTVAMYQRLGWADRPTEQAGKRTFYTPEAAERVAALIVTARVNKKK